MKATIITILLSISLLFQSWQPKPKWYRIIIKEYSGGALWPPENLTKQVYVDLYDHRFLKIRVYDKRGKMHLQCYSRDSVLLEEGNYINSLALLKNQSPILWAGNRDKKIREEIFIYEYYEPLRNGLWKFYDSTGRLKDSMFYQKGIQQTETKKS